MMLKNAPEFSGSAAGWMATACASASICCCNSPISVEGCTANCCSSAASAAAKDATPDCASYCVPTSSLSVRSSASKEANRLSVSGPIAASWATVAVLNRLKKNIYQARSIRPVRGSIIATRGGVIGVGVADGELGIGASHIEFGTHDGNFYRISTRHFIHAVADLKRHAQSPPDGAVAGLADLAHREPMLV